MNINYISETRKTEIKYVIPATVKELTGSKTAKGWIRNHWDEFQFKTLSEISLALRYVKILWNIKNEAEKSRRIYDENGEFKTV